MYIKYLRISYLFKKKLVYFDEMRMELMILFTEVSFNLIYQILILHVSQTIFSNIIGKLSPPLNFFSEIFIIYSFKLYFPPKILLYSNYRNK